MSKLRVFRTGVTASALLGALISPIYAQARNPNIRHETLGQILGHIQQANRGGKMRLKKTEVALPRSRPMQMRRHYSRDLWQVKPPRTQDFYQKQTSDQAELEHITDLQIQKLYQLTQEFRNSPARGELWLRLAQLYAEKAQMVEFRKQHQFDEQMNLYDHHKLSFRPHLDLRESDNYRMRSIRLYKWYVQDFPRSPRVDQALFFLGYNFIELGKMKTGVAYYAQLTKEFPRSAYRSESEFALGDYYFQNQNWQQALSHYMNVVRWRGARLHDFALYKAAWCLYRMGKSTQGLKFLEAVIRHGQQSQQQAQLAGRPQIDTIRLAMEAVKDLVLFYSDANLPADRAQSYFMRMSNNAAETQRMVEGLAYSEAAAGRRSQATYLFHSLILQNPNAPKAFEYQYQIVLNYVNVGKGTRFRHALYDWIGNFGPNSEWARVNSSNQALVSSSEALLESTLRNYVLQLHQTAQNNRLRSSQIAAFRAYILYLRSFPNSPKATQMHFFFGELLFDMQRWQDAANQYLWVVNHGNGGPYRERAALDAVLSLNKILPNEKAIRKRLGTNMAMQPMPQSATAFASAAENYIHSYPMGKKVLKIEFSLGRLYFTFNHFAQSDRIFRDIIRRAPRSKEAEYSANMMLDGYNLRKDYAGLAKAGSFLLKNPALSHAMAGQDIQGIVDRANFKQAQNLEANKDYSGAARSYQMFAQAHPTSALSTMAEYNSGIDYERAHYYLPALQMYGAVLNSHGKKSRALRSKTQKLYAHLAFKLGQLREAARYFEAYAASHPNDKDSSAFYYNAALIYAGYNMEDAAVRDYTKYFEMRRAPDYREAYYDVAEMYRHHDHIYPAMNYYERYLDSHPHEGSHILRATYEIGHLSERLHHNSDALKWYRRTIAVYHHLKEAGRNIKAGPAAKAQLSLSRQYLYELREIHIPPNPNRQAKAVQSKLALINTIQSKMATVISYDYGPAIVGAFTTLGQAYDNIVQTVSHVPPPPGLSPKDLKAYEAGVEKQILAPMRKKAVENYKSALARANQVAGFGKWTLEARRGLERYSPKDVSGSGELAPSAHVIDWMAL